MTEHLRNTSEEVLWSAFQQGDEAAYALIYERFVGGLYSYGRQFTKDVALVQDCIQDLFVTIWNNRRNLGQAKSIKFYLNSSLKRELIRRLKASRTSLEEVEDDYIFGITLDIEAIRIQEETNSEQLHRLNEALQKLPPRQKEALYLRFYENLSYDEIASLMEITSSVAYNFVYRGLSVLKKSFQATLKLLFLFFPIG
ncbi:RNA polymerase sigma factor [Larkinella insperata]|uniref:RNA polymerase sigma factor n=1 Tax=Larkinella insperata TaxID=332158 RepID=A0ABW3QH91_9BACT